MLREQERKLVHGRVELEVIREHLDAHYSNFGVDMNQRDSDSVGLGWGLSACMFHKLPGDMDACICKIHFEEPGFREALSVGILERKKKGNKSSWFRKA